MNLGLLSHTLPRPNAEVLGNNLLQPTPAVYDDFRPNRPFGLIRC